MILKNLSCKYTIILFLSLIFNINLAQKKQNNDSLNHKKDTIKINKNKLEDILEYKAQEIKNNLPKKVSYLIEKAEVKYQDLNILADYIFIDWNSGEVYGRGKIDSTGKIIENVNFEQAGKKYDYKEFKFNFKSKKGQAFGVRTEEGEGVIIAKKTKKANDSVIYFRHMQYTTDTYFKTQKDTIADYYLKAGKGKYTDKKSLVTGPIQMFIENVPTPFVMPFFYLPKLGDTRSAGILIPSFGERQAEGFYLQGLGYYVPIGDNFDLTLKSDLYTKGSWAIYASSRYMKRYKYNGSFAANYTNRISGIKGLDDYAKSTLYNLQWSHQQDSKSNPNLIFGASVNFMSSKYYQNGLNNNNILNGNYLQNTASSSISIQKRFPNTPFNASLNLSHNQNNQSQLYSFTLPILTVNMNRIYPFAPKIGAKKGLVQNINFNYNFNSQNTYNNIHESEIFKPEMFKKGNTGFKGDANLSTNQTIFNYFNLSFGGTYNHVGTLKTIRKHYDLVSNQVVTTDVNEFKMFQTFGFSSGLTTQVFGMMRFKKGSKIEAIRHVISPTIGYSLTPDFSTDSWGYYRKYYDKNGKEVKYSIFDGGIYGSPGNVFSSSVNLSLNNNIEMKIRGSKKDSVDVKKIKLFDNLSLSTSYNIAGDSMKLAPINITSSTSFFNSKLRVGFSGRINPYKIKYTNINGFNQGNFINQLGGFTLTDYNLNMDYSFNSSEIKNKKKTSELYKNQGSIRNEVFYFDDENYAHFDQPWNVSLGLMYNHRKDFSGRPNIKENNVSMRISGGLSPSPYWTITGNTSYDFETKKLSNLILNLNRDLRSFNITFSWVPIGYNKTWNFFIGIKASMLKDALKYEKHSFNTVTGF